VPPAAGLAKRLPEYFEFFRVLFFIIHDYLIYIYTLFTIVILLSWQTKKNRKLAARSGSRKEERERGSTTAEASTPGRRRGSGMQRRPVTKLSKVSGLVYLLRKGTGRVLLRTCVVCRALGGMLAKVTVLVLCRSCQYTFGQYTHTCGVFIYICIYIYIYIYIYI
jgi:hypothetical protein